ncbi:hypothetical protein TorRG33x02_147030 [Trema orientale]|uniref:Uncharacterized protein n=1 Tax=Trema orientale TaxID=63057 RepID=A0A2P5EVJ7_TREOI|nr:hypothetical protein TorRG33x02_147030 [Trema orientale]
MRLRGRCHVDSEEGEAISIATTLEQGSEGNDLAGPVDRARHVEPLSLSYQTRPQLVPLGQLVVEHRHGPEHELLEGEPWRELGPVHEREPATACDEVVVVVVAVLEHVSRVTG